MMRGIRWNRGTPATSRPTFSTGALLGAALLATGSCTNASNAGDTTAQPLAAVALAGYRMDSEVADVASIKARVHGLAEILLSRTVNAGSSLARLDEALAREPALPVDAPLADDDQTVVGYDRVSRFWAINSRVSRNVDRAAPDVTAAGAKVRFEATLEELVKRGLVKAGDYDFDDLREGAVRAGYGRSGVGVEAEWIKEYRFTVPRKVDGIEIYDAGITVSVHRGGELASIAVSGPTVLPGTRLVGVQKVSAAALDARFSREHPGMSVLFSGVRYVYLKPGLVRPRQMYKFASVLRGPDGRTGTGRAMHVAYSLENEDDPALEWPRYDPANVGGDARP